MVLLLSYQTAVFVKFPIVTKFVFRDFLYLISSLLHVVLSRYWAHTLMKVTGKVKVLHEIDLVCDHLKNTKRKLVTNLESPELSLYAFKSVCRTILETLWGKLQNLLGMKLTTGVTLLLLSAVDNNFVFISQVLTMKSTEPTNICYIIDKVACTIKRNIKEAFLKNNGFARIYWRKERFLLLCPHSREPLNLC